MRSSMHDIAHVQGFTTIDAYPHILSHLHQLHNPSHPVLLHSQKMWLHPSSYNNMYIGRSRTEGLGLW
jgi:hypothetical protein